MNTKNKKANPKISVIITCYNYGEFIDEAIQSVKDQTFRNWEIIVIDDCSTDEFTQDKIKHLSTNIAYPDLKIIALKENVGVCKARNLGTERAKGEYIIYLDADDKIEEDCLQKMYNIIKEGKYDIIGANMVNFDELGILNKNKRHRHRQYDKYKLCMECLIIPASLFRRNNWERLGGIRENMYKGFEDYDFWLGLVQDGAEVYIIPEILFHHRVHDKLISRDTKAVKIKDELNSLIIANNSKLFRWFIKEQKKRTRNFKRILTIFLSLSVLINLIQILL